MEPHVQEARERQYQAHLAQVARIVEAEIGKPITDIPQAAIDAAGLSDNIVVQIASGPEACAAKIIDAIKAFETSRA